jgi:hypothetical protein
MQVLFSMQSWQLWEDVFLTMERDCVDLISDSYWVGGM